MRESRDAQRIIVADAARRDLLAGVDALARLARVTLGPRGRNVALVHRDYPGPRVANRTHFILDDLELADPAANVGAKLLRQVAARAGEAAGDGTTTAIVLCQAMIAEGVRQIAAGANPMLLRRGLERAGRAAADVIGAMARPVAGLDEIRRLTTTWSGDAAIGAVIAEALDRVGEDGLISLERSHRAVPLALELVAGMTLPTGSLSPNFVPPGGSRSIELTEPAILLTDREIAAQDDLAPLLDALVRQERRDLLVMAADVAGPALALLTANAAAGVLRCVAVRTPEVNEHRIAILEDLAVWTGARFVSADCGDRLAGVTPADLGRARSAHVDDDTTVIVGGRGDPEAARRRVAAIKAAARACGDPYKKEKLDRRVARLTGGVAVIWYGGATDAERNERRLRLEDAVAGLWAALRGGVVPGGGVALLGAERCLDQLDASGDEAAGVRVVRHALAAPLRQLADNAGARGGTVVADIRRLQREGGHPGAGYDVVAGDYCDLAERGVMDPAEVVVVALETAVSAAALALTTEAIVLPRPSRSAPGPTGGA